MRLKLYIQDRGVYGMTMVVAYDIEAATKLISQDKAYEEKMEIDEFPIEEGFLYSNWGDR